jgi:cytoskeletal protein CcmA (bactofilin family)
MSEPDHSETEYKQTTVEAGTQFKGTLISACEVIVRGVVDGELQAPSLVVTETGTVTGHVKVKSLHSLGTLSGRIEADEIQLAGHVRSDTVIRAKSMEVKLQSHGQPLEVTFGECTLDVGDDPTGELSAAMSARTAGVSAASSKKTARRADTAAVLENSDAHKSSEGSRTAS